MTVPLSVYIAFDCSAHKQQLSCDEAPIRMLDSIKADFTLIKEHKCFEGIRVLMSNTLCYCYTKHSCVLRCLFV